MPGGSRIRLIEILRKARGLDPHLVGAYIMEALLEAQRKNPEKAAAILDEGIKANPKALGLYQVRARLAEQQRDYDQAAAFLKKAEEIDPKNIRLQDDLLRLYALQKKWDKVEETLRTKAALEPDQGAHVSILARFLADRGRFDEGEKLLEEFIAKHPQDLQARLTLADFYLNHRKIGQGTRSLKEIIAKDPTSPTGIMAKDQLAILLLSQGHQDEGAKLVQEVLQTNPKDVKALELQGLLAMAKKDGQKAVDNFRILTQGQPNNQEYRLLLARAYLVNKDRDLAKEAAKKAINLKPDYLDAKNFLYNMYLQDKDYDGLIKLIKDYLRDNDKDLANWEALGNIYALKGNKQEARAAFEKMIALNPKSPAGYMKMAIFSQENQHPEEAVKYLETALQQNPNFYPAERLLLALYLKQGQPVKMLAAARAAVAAAPKNPETHSLLGEALLSQKQPEAAVGEVEQALSLNPFDGQAMGLLLAAYKGLPDQKQAMLALEQKAADSKAPFFYALALAQLYEKQNEAAKAIPIYEGLLARGVDSLMVKNNLAYLLAEVQPTPESLARAEKLATGVLDDNPEDPRLLDTVGWIYCRQEHYERAKPLLEKASEKSPNNPAVEYHLGFCAAKLGDAATARRCSGESGSCQR